MSRLQEHWPAAGRGPHGGGCRCGWCAAGPGSIDRLARESLGVALAHAQQGRFEADMGTEAGRQRTLTLPGMFSGWRDPVPIMQVLGANPPVAFMAKKGHFLYRISKRGVRRPLYIGMSVSARVRDRVRSHVGALIVPSTKKPPVGWQARIGKSEIANLRQEITTELQADKTLQNITVQLGTVVILRHRLDAKLLHAYEAALQVTERPKTYVGSAWTFEEDN